MLDYLMPQREGEWSVENFEVDQQGADLHNLREMIHRTGRVIVPGTYTKLEHDRRGIIMTDTPAEVRDLVPFQSAVQKAAMPGGSSFVRIHGLGLGIAAKMALDTAGISRVDVVEIAPEVIKLTGDPLKRMYGDRLRIIEGDVFLMKPGQVRYKVVWHDVWDTICADNYLDYVLLHRRWGRMADWQGSWCFNEVKREARQ